MNIHNKNNNKISNENLPWEENESKKFVYKKTINITILDIIKFILLALLIIIIITSICNYINSKNNNDVDISLITHPSDSTKMIQVHISGEVVNPNVYKIESGSRVIDLVNMAGGFTENANKEKVNLAKTLEDAEQVNIEAINKTEENTNNEKTSNTSTSSSPQNTTSGKININTADITQLQTLSGVGPSTAQKIIDFRNANGKFKTIDDLKKVSGIGEKTFAKFADKICV